MYKWLGNLLLVACLLPLSSAPAWGDPPAPNQPEPEKVRIDQYGDPLPAGAVARIGTARLRHGDSCLRLAYAPDGKTLAAGRRDKLIRLWDPATGKLRLTIQEHPNAIQSLAFSPDSKLLASAASSRNDWTRKPKKAS